MKKRFISVAAFCALLAAPVFVGCSDDYDDDITNLQSQIDELKGSAVTVEEAQAAITEAVNALKEELNTAIGNKANNADVNALQEAVRELSDALNGNADDQTVTGLVEQVQELAARVNEIEDTSLAELEKQLTEGLADLRAAYEAADDALEASLANKAEADAVTTLQGQMTTVQGDLQGALADLATLKADGDATALLNKINNLVSQYEDLSNKLAEKASQETVDGLNETLKDLNETISGLEGQVDGVEGSISDLQADLLECVNKTELSELQGQINDLVEDLNALPTDADVAAAIQEKIDELGELVSVNVFEAYKSEISEQMGGLTERIADCESRLTKVEQMAKDNAQDIIDLGLRIDNLEDILAGFENNPGGDVSETLLGQIVALTERLNAIDTEETGALAQLNQKYNTLNSAMANMQAKLTETQLNALNDIAGWDSEKNGSIVSVLNKVIALEEALNAKTEEGEPAFDLTDIATQLGNLQTELDELGLMTKMIQSIVFVPNFEDNGTEVVYDKRVSFKTLQLIQNPGTIYSYWKTMSENKEQTMKFRISPATLTKEDFEKNYDISFYGEQVATRSKQPTVLTNVTVESLEDGLLTLKVTAGESVGDGQSYRAWALSARITPKADVENNEKYTDVFSDYFVVDNRVDRVNNIRVATNVGGHKEITYNDHTTKYNFAESQKLWGVVNGAPAIDLAAEYPSIMDAITVKYNQSGDDYYFAFDNGTVSLKDNVNQSGIGQGTSVSATVTVANCNNSYTTQLGSVSIVQATPEYDVTGVQTAGWFVGTADKKIFTVSGDQIREIMERSNMTPTAFWAAVAQGTPNGMNGDVYFAVNGQSIEIYQKPATTITGGQIEFVFETNETGNEFTLKAQIAAMTDAQYPTLTINRESAAWDGNTIGLLPTLAGNTMTLVRDLTTVFSDYADLVADAAAQSGMLSWRVLDNNNNNVTGTYLNGNTLTINPTNYSGQSLRFELAVDFDGKRFVIDEGAINVQDLSGAWKVNTTSTYDPKSRTLDASTLNTGINLAQGFEWVDFEGETMWKDGTTQANNPLSKYGLTAPTFSIVSGDNQFVELNGSTLSFKQGTENNFQTAHTMVIEIKATNRWGDIDNFNGNNRITVTIPAGTYTR